MTESGAGQLGVELDGGAFDRIPHRAEARGEPAPVVGQLGLAFAPVPSRRQGDQPELRHLRQGLGGGGLGDAGRLRERVHAAGAVFQQALHDWEEARPERLAERGVDLLHVAVEAGDQVPQLRAQSWCLCHI